MSADIPLGDLPDDELERRAERLRREAGRGSKKKAPGRRAQKKQEQASAAQGELDAIETVIAQRLEMEASRVRGEAQQTLIAYGVSAMRIYDYKMQYRIRTELADALGIDESAAWDMISDAFYNAERKDALTHDETVLMYTDVANDAYATSPYAMGALDQHQRDTMQFITYPWTECKKKSDVGAARSSTDFSVLTIPPEREEEVNMPQENLFVPLENVVTIKQKPVSRMWTSIIAGKIETYLNNVESTNIDTTVPSSQLDEALFTADTIARQEASLIASALSIENADDGELYLKAAAKLVARHPKLSQPDFIMQIANSNPANFIHLMDGLEHHVSTIHTGNGPDHVVHPLCLEEAYLRLETHIFTLLNAAELCSAQHAVDPLRRKWLSPQQQQDLVPFAQRVMDSIPETIAPGDAELNDLLEILCPELLESELIQNVHFTRAGGRIHVVIPGNFSEEFTPFQERLEKGNRHILNLRDIVHVDMRTIRGTLKDIHKWDEGEITSFPLCTLEELEAHFFAVEDVEGRFLPAIDRDKKADDDEDSSDAVEPSDNPDLDDNWHALPRMRALRSALLREQVHATYSYDETESANDHDFGKLERGHYAVVTITDLNLQIIVSDDPQLGCYQVFNNNAPIDYTNVQLPEISQMGATPIRWDSAEQLIRSIRTSIKQQKEHPITVYPVHPSVENTPIDDLLDNRQESESIEHLRYDITRAAAACGKADAPWTMTTGDFSQIESGNILWSFGGNAHGITYLSRVGRRMGLDNRDAASEELTQRNLAPFTLKWILRAVYPEQMPPIVARPEVGETTEQL